MSRKPCQDGSSSRKRLELSSECVKGVVEVNAHGDKKTLKSGVPRDSHTEDGLAVFKPPWFHQSRLHPNMETDNGTLLEGNYFLLGKSLVRLLEEGVPRSRGALDDASILLDAPSMCLTEGSA